MNVGFPPLAGQAQRQPAPMAFNFSRRYACDRCRGQKLRCNRDLMALADTPCLRCRKAKAKCTIASSSSRRGTGTGPARGRSWDVSRGLPNTATILEPDVGPAQAEVASVSLRSNINKHNIAQPACQPPWSATADIQSPGDILQLEPISWQDVFGSTFDDVEEVDFRSAADTLPTPVSPNHVMLSKLPTNQPTVASAYQFSSSNISDMVKNDAPFTVSAMNKTAADRDSATPPGAVRARPSGSETLNPTHLVEEESNLLESPKEPILVSLDDRHTGSGHEPDQDVGEGSGIPLTTLKDKNIEILSDLSASLLKDLHRIIACESAGSFLRTHSDHTAAEYFFKTMNCTTSSDYIIGKMLHGSERFLEVVQSLNKPPPSHPCPDSEHSTDGENCNFGGSEEITDSSETSLDARMEERWRFIQTVLSRAAYVAGDGSTGTGSSMNISRGHQPNRDAPSTFALLTCYTCLLKIYESVFSIIHHSFEVSRKWTVATRLPQTITGLQIDGFVLQNHRDLQIKILIQVSTYMLDSIEKALGGTLSDPLFQALLKASLQQEGYVSLGHNETGTRIVRDMIKKIEDTFLNSDR
ncbi:hypothetical protein B0O99DRAFT_691918 [Bisporella sp. PMI_857]|nr:hypothetical protein B0O99DRAFT_691918 [Bisporella sp. PMI_857]